MNSTTDRYTVWPSGRRTEGGTASPYNRATFATIADRLRTIVDSGGTLAPEVEAALAGWDNYTVTVPDDGVSELAAAVMAGGDPEGLAEWHGRAMSRHSSHRGEAGQRDAAVRNAVAAHIGPQLRATYLDTTAEDNVTAARRRFNSVAADYRTAADVVAPDVEPAEVVGQPAKVQKAWMALASLRSQLDAAHAALELAHAAASHDVTGPPAVCTLDSLNAADLRELRGAWITGDTRPGGKWWALIQAGAELHADAHTGRAVMREPRNTEQRQIPGPNGHGIIQPELDPEDPQQRAELERIDGLEAGALELPNVLTGPGTTD